MSSELNVGVYNVQFSVNIHTQSYGMSLQFVKDVIRIDVVTQNKKITGNQFRIQLVPTEYDDKGNTAYELVKPMDYVEVSVRRETKSGSLKPIVVMRGFVSKVCKTTTLQNGQPTRAIEILGEDYGKVVRMAYLHYQGGLDPLQVVAAAGTPFALTIGYGLDFVFHRPTPSQAMQRVFEIFIQPNFANVKQLIDHPEAKTKLVDGKVVNVPPSDHVDNIGDFLIDIDEDGVDGKRRSNIPLKIIDSQIGLSEQSIEELMMHICGLPWNEIYVDNAPEKTYLVYRPYPYRDRDKNYIGGTHFGISTGANYTPPEGRPEKISLTKEDIISIDVCRSDEDVYNYFLTDATFSGFGDSFESIARSRFVRGNGTRVGNPHYTVGEAILSSDKVIPASEKLEYSRIELFGFRKFWTTVNWLAVEPEDKTKQSSDPLLVRTGDVLNQIMFNALEHNSALENGTVVIKGNEYIRPGMYVELDDRRMNSSPSMYYVAGVNHIIVPFTTFVTQLALVRGEGWLSRKK